MQVIEAILFVVLLAALGLLIVGPFAFVRALAYRRVIRGEVSRRGGQLVRIFPSWVFRIVVEGWNVGRRIRFKWVDQADRVHVSECQFMHVGMESLTGRGRFRWLGDVHANQIAEPDDERERRRTGS
ncbi:MAG TPA: hypothetical protein VMP01_19555 [Pirellulaceae bacterium]|nr:hypothetical protein [Pirellulaceae bacterium]